MQGSDVCPDPANAELLDQLLVACVIVLAQVGEQPVAPANERYEPALGVLVLLVLLEVLGQTANTLGQHRDLNLCGATVPLVDLVLLNDCGLIGHLDAHVSTLDRVAGSRDRRRGPDAATDVFLGSQIIWTRS